MYSSKYMYKRSSVSWVQARSVRPSAVWTARGKVSSTSSSASYDSGPCTPRGRRLWEPLPPSASGAAGTAPPACAGTPALRAETVGSQAKAWARAPNRRPRAHNPRSNSKRRAAETRRAGASVCTPTTGGHSCMHTQPAAMVGGVMRCSERPGSCAMSAASAVRGRRRNPLYPHSLTPGRHGWACASLLSNALETRTKEAPRA